VTFGANFPQIFGAAAFASEPVIIVAVSGGSDSTALLFRTQDTVGPATRLVGVTIDHGLRPESASEAAAVAELCAAHGIEHRTVRWEGTKPATGIQAAARWARYDLLATAAIELGGRLVLTGHTADDQAETIWMRRQRGEGLGLAGIAPVTLYDRKVWFARPQLGERRAALRAWLRERDISWFDDPSNNNEAFERVRVRRELAGLSGGGFAQLIETGVRAAAERIELGQRAAVLIERYACLPIGALGNTPTPNPSPQGGGELGNVGAFPSPLRGGVRGGGKTVSNHLEGSIVLDLPFLDEDAADAIHALRILLAVVGGTEQLPDLQRTTALFHKLRDTARGRFSLAKTVIARRKGDLLLTRERRGTDAETGREAMQPMRSPWERLLPWFDMEPARAVDHLLAKTPPPALPWP